MNNAISGTVVEGSGVNRLFLLPGGEKKYAVTLALYCRVTPG
jgi:hypothetical protein